MKRILEIVERLGYDNCLVNKKRGPFIKSLNNIMHGQDGPLFQYKQIKDASFQKKVSQSLKLLDTILLTPHSDRDG